MRIETRALLIFLFVGYNLLLASTLASPLAVSRVPAENQVSVGDSDFSPQAPPPTPPIRISKPFYAISGDALSFEFEQYSVDNKTGFTFVADNCHDCNMLIVPLPLPPPPAPFTNGTFVSGIETYNVTKTDDYVLISDTRGYLECFAHPNCIVKLSGTVTETAPAILSPYSALPSQLEILGTVTIATTMILWILRQLQLRRRPLDERFK